jgi:glycerophosphoryl diester phosphodiesterase
MFKSPFPVIAHRGASGYELENSFAAFDKAVALNADMIETDVQETKDGALILMHDPTVDRTTYGKGRIEDLTLRELGELRLRNQQKIPLFDKLLRSYGKRVPLNIELKADGIEKRVYELLNKNNILEHVLISSYSFTILENLRELHETLHLSWISRQSEYRLRTAVDYDKLLDLKIEYIQPLHFSVSKPFMDESRRHGLKIFPWPIDSKLLALKFKDQFQVTGIISKFPDILDKSNDFNRIANHL